MMRRQRGLAPGDGGPTHAVLRLQGDDARDAELGSLGHDEVHGRPAGRDLRQGDGKTGRGLRGVFRQQAGLRAPGRGLRQLRGPLSTGAVEDRDQVARAEAQDGDKLVGLRRAERRLAPRQPLGREEESSVMRASHGAAGLTRRGP